MPTVTPFIEPAIFELAPGFRALSISVENAHVAEPGLAAEVLQGACQSLAAGGPAWAEAHLAAWADVFRKFGAKPQRTPCSAEALRKRVLRDGHLQSLDPVVDLYNAISIQYAVPVGGENLSTYIGTPRLVVADGTELFDTIKEGQPAQEAPESGEVIWRDDVGVTCRRWNWRQGVRTRLSSEARRMWFILESLPAMPAPALHEAGERLVEGLHLMMPDASISTKLVGIETT